MKEENSSQLSPKLLYATKLALVVLVLSGVGLFLYFFQPSWLKFNFIKEAKAPTIVQTETATTTNPVVCLDCVGRQLDGVLVKPELAKLRPFGVMIDNFLSARPQSGLGAASLVYEAPAEGGITRYEAFFDPETMPREIGPVRSARPYFVNWSKELGATYVHVGGSPDALDILKNLGKSNLDEFSHSPYFWRSNERTAPHNVLTSANLLNKYRTDNNETGTDLFPWKFKEAAATGTSFISKIKVKYSAGYDVYWQYQMETNSYERYQDNNLFLDAQGLKVSAKNIIIQVSSFVVSDDKLRLTMSTALSGQALLCQDGDCQPGTWKKNSTAVRAKYYDKQGIEFIFNSGVTWIEVVSGWSMVEY